MQHVIIVIHLMVVVALVALVLYQKSEGGALGIGSSGFLTGRGQANALTRATGILGTIFFVTSLALTILPAWQRGSSASGDWSKAIDQGNIQLKEIPAPAAPDAAKDGKESIFEQLQRAQEQRQKAGAPVAPPAEAPKATPAPKGAEAPKPAESAKPAEPAKSVEPKPVETKPSEAPKAQAPSAPPAAESEKPALRPSVVEPAKPATEAAPGRSFAPSWLRSSGAQTETPANEPARSSEPGAGESKEKPAAAPPTIWKAPAQ